MTVAFVSVVIPMISSSFGPAIMLMLTNWVPPSDEVSVVEHSVQVAPPSPE